MRTVHSHSTPDIASFKRKLLQWAQQFREVVFLDSNSYPQEYGSFDFILAADAFTSIKTGEEGALQELDAYQTLTRDWLFGYMGYDLKNGIEKLKSNNFDGLEFPALYFFQPKKLFLCRDGAVTIEYLNVYADEIQQDLCEIDAAIISEPQLSEIDIKARNSKESYLLNLEKMQSHIAKGDIYEANFCMEFFAEGSRIEPVGIFTKLNAISTPPFSAYVKHFNHYAMCASPERFLKKSGNKIISQPIKGTAKRSLDPVEDAAISRTLLESEKERSENIMIVDLVRNDLSRTASKGSVEVLELCGLYTFKQVHHLISTVTSLIDDNVSAVEVIRNAFPMGSMTGAPKISAMNIIERLEASKRGLYSGSIGYFTPDGDFDFNVVIRSILYNAEKRYVSFSVGSAITSLSNPELEYQECLLKADAMRRVLGITP